MTKAIHRFIVISILLLNVACSRQIRVNTKTYEMSIRSDYEGYLLGEKDFFEFHSQKEFTSRLSGNNPSGICYLVLEPYPKDKDGLIIDEWGRPFRISRPGKAHLEIRSAGQDGEFGTKDDIVTVHPRVKGQI
jgi:hypothetical protein